MVPIRVPVPRKALVRIQSQSPAVSDLQSCQQEIFMVIQNFATLDAYLATPGNECYIQLDATDYILPYTSVEIQIGVTPVDPSTWTPWSVGVYLTPADTTPALAIASICTQLRAYVNQMVRLGFPAFDSFKFGIRGTTELKILMPWGILGAGGFNTDGPDGVEGAVAGLPGIDHPLWFGIIGPRRHCFRVLPTYPGPYYGSIPIG